MYFAVLHCTVLYCTLLYCTVLFIVDRFTVNLTENKPAGSERVSVINTVDLDDEDEDDIKTDVCYFIVGGTEGSADLFDLNRYTHQMMATR